MITERNLLYRYLTLMFPHKLEEDEYICLYFNEAKGKKDKEYKFNKFYKNFDDIVADVEKYKHMYNTYICIYTVKGNENRQERNIYKRSCIVFDFDFKDHNDITDPNYYITMMKSKYPELYYHYIVLSGNGIHIYSFAEPTTNKKQIASINLEIAENIGADMGACLSTQVIRVPTTYNLKKEKKFVRIYNDDTDKSNFKRYKLSRLKQIITPKVEREQQIRYKDVDLTSIKKLQYCVQGMLTTTIVKGQRNFCLGRIVANLKVAGYEESKARDIVLNWNREQCEPQKGEREIEKDFLSYWNNDYRLLGCSIKQPSKQAILDQFCDKHKCDYLLGAFTEDSELKEDVIAINNRWLGVGMMKELSAKHYIVISLLLRAENKGMTLKDMQKFLQPRKKGERSVIGEDALRKIINDLRTKGILEVINPIRLNESKYILLKDYDKTYGTGYTRYLHSGAMLTIQKVLTPREFLIYITIAKYRGQGKFPTLQDITLHTGIVERNVHTDMKSLHEMGLLSITSFYNTKGVKCNRVSIVA